MSQLYPCLLHLLQAFIFTAGTMALPSKLICLPLAANWVIVNMDLMTALPAIKPSMAPYCSRNKVQIPQPAISGLVQVGLQVATQICFSLFPYMCPVL